MRVPRTMPGNGATLAPATGAVHCLIDVVDHADHRLVRLVGRLTSAHVPELREACLGNHASVRLNLNELISVDPVGVDVLLELRNNGTELLEVPAYIQLK